MVIMKDSEDPPWVSVGDIYRRAVKHNNRISVEKILGNTTVCGQVSSEYVYTAGRLILFFTDSVCSEFQLHDRVYLRILYKYPKD